MQLFDKIYQFSDGFLGVTVGANPKDGVVPNLGIHHKTVKKFTSYNRQKLFELAKKNKFKITEDEHVFYAYKLREKGLETFKFSSGVRTNASIIGKKGKTWL